MKTCILKITTIIVLVLASFSTVLAQDSALKSVTVTGKSEITLSPDEIIVTISFQEYFKDKEETSANKVTIEELEQKVLAAVNKAGIVKGKITSGAATLVKPYDSESRSYKKRRLNKSILVCVGTTAAYIKLTRTLESENLFDTIITDFSIAEYRHTKKEEYLDKSRSEAYQNALKKAKLILSTSGQKVGKLITIKEVMSSGRTSGSGGFYMTKSNSALETSGFKPIVISYEIIVAFEIL
ncbi:MAG: hypothetical protein ACJAZ2_002326 [Glaciecola sp.]|jgi:uncharacterized protein YggE